jgi:ABC-type Zn2+ transport system substrate-binding protein/surface adhesin
MPVMKRNASSEPKSQAKADRIDPAASKARTREQRILATDLIAEPADHDTADHRAGQRHRHDQAGLRQGHVERFLNLRQQKRHDDQIVEIEGVAEDRRPGHEAPLAAGISQLDRGQGASPHKIIETLKAVKQAGKS